VEFRPNSDWQIFDHGGRRKYADERERRRFLEAADEADARTKALAYLLAFAGCRISEALALTRDHLDIANSTITFRTLKRRRLSFRSVPIPAHITGMLIDLETQPGEQFWPMHRVTAWRQIKALFDDARVSGPMACCRGLRHGFGIHAATRYVPPNLIQRWMGHAHASTTAIYLDAVGNEERLFAERMWAAPK
jgi:integrase